MTKRDLFRLIIKIAGLYFVVTTVFSPIPGNLYFLLTYADSKSLLHFFIASILLLGLFTVFIFMPDLIIRLLRLDKGFDDNRVETKEFTAEKILVFALVILGGMLIIQNIPLLVSNGITVFKPKTDEIAFLTSNTKIYIQMAINGLNILVGLLLILGRNLIVRLLSKK